MNSLRYHGGWDAWCCLAALAAILLFIPIPNDGLPQLVRGDDALSVAFGGAKEMIGLAMVHKADSYFHGGVDMEHTLDHDHDEDCVCDHTDTAKPDHQTIRPSNNSFDPWAWINLHIRAPEVERHLEGEKAVELMPWFWASVKANPHNADAWTSALYVAERMLNDDALARRILAEAKAKNPESAEIAFAEGRFLYKQGKGDVPAAKAAFVRARFLVADAKSESDQMLLRMIDGYLTHIGE